MSIENKGSQAIDGVADVHGAASREDAASPTRRAHPGASFLKVGAADHDRFMRLLVRHQLRTLTSVPCGAASRVIPR